MEGSLKPNFEGNTALMAVESLDIPLVPICKRNMVGGSLNPNLVGNTVLMAVESLVIPLVSISITDLLGEI